MEYSLWIDVIVFFCLYTYHAGVCFYVSLINLTHIMCMSACSFVCFIQILAALKTLADANRTGKEEDLMEACNLVSETVPHQGLHLQVMLDSLTLIEQLQGEDGDNPFSEEERFTDDASRETSMGGSGSISGSISGSGNVEGVTVCENPLLHRGTLPIPPSPRFAPPPPPTTFSSSDSSAPSPQSQPWTGGEGGEGDGGGKDTTPAPPTFNSIDTSLPKPIPEAPLPRKVITRMVSQEIINVSDSLQYHIEKLFNASKCREGLSEEMAPLNEALQATLACDSVRAEDIGLMHEAADELEHAGLQLEVLRVTRIYHNIAQPAQHIMLTPVQNIITSHHLTSHDIT